MIHIGSWILPALLGNPGCWLLVARYRIPDTGSLHKSIFVNRYWLIVNREVACCSIIQPYIHAPIQTYAAGMLDAGFLILPAPMGDS